MQPKKFVIFWSFTTFSLNVATKDPFRYKKSKKKSISDAKILNAKAKECDQNNLCFSDHFQTFLSSFAKHFLGVSPQTSLEVAIKVFLKN